MTYFGNSWLRFLRSQETDYYTELARYREYTEGDQTQVLSEKQRKLIKSDGDVRCQMNICPLILDTEADRLELRGVKVALDDDQAETGQALSDQSTRWRRQSRMDEFNDAAHWYAARDGNSYALIEYDADLGRPVVHIHEAYDGEEGVDVVHTDESGREIDYAVKYWDEKLSDTTGNRVRRINIYLKDRVYKLVSNSFMQGGSPGMAYKAYAEDGEVDEVRTVEFNGKKFDAGIVWWTHDRTEDGIPLGVPVVQFKHGRGGKYGRSVLADVVPYQQDDLNRIVGALTYATLFAGFNQNIITGYAPPDDTPTGLEKFYPVPGAVQFFDNGTGDSRPINATQFTATDLSQLIGVKDSKLRDISMQTQTPLSILNATAQLAAEGTLQQMEAPLVAKIKHLQVSYGNTHEDIDRVMMRLDAVFNDNSPVMTTLDLPQRAVEQALAAIEQLDLKAEWAPAQTRSETSEIENAARKVNELGMPREQVWSELGYTPQQVQAMVEGSEDLSDQVIAELARRLLGEETGDGVEQGAGESSAQEVAADAANVAA